MSADHLTGLTLAVEYVLPLDIGDDARRRQIAVLAAGSILAAGWRPPARVVTTVGERRELLMRVSETAEPAYVRDRWRRHWLITEDDDGEFWAWSWQQEGEAALRPVDAEELAMPLTVLHEGGEAP